MRGPEAGTAVGGEGTADDGGRSGASSTRRGVLGVVATLGGVALAGCASITDDEPVSYARTVPSTPTVAPGTTGAGAGTETATATETETPTAADVSTLNDALAFEHLESALYRAGLDAFADGEFVRADVLSRFDDRVRRAVPGYLRTARAQEAAHVEALAATVEDLGGEPVAAAEYEFGFERPVEFLRAARTLEEAGVAAYAGVAPAVVNRGALATVLGVHSVEARHAGLLALLFDDSPFPRAVDEAGSTAAALAAAGDVVAGGVASDADGDGDGDANGDGDASAFEREASAEPARTREDGTSDVEALNGLLALEQLENALYREGLERYDATALAGADALSGFSFPFRATVHRRLSAAGTHEAAHVEALAATVEALGGEPVAAAEYEFDYGTPSEFLGVARTLENAGVAAYAGAAPSIANDDALATALGVHSVEARHAGFCNLLGGTPPFPDGVDEPLSPADLRTLLDRFAVA
jgi:hypothetical protein